MCMKVDAIFSGRSCHLFFTLFPFVAHPSTLFLISINLNRYRRILRPETRPIRTTTDSITNRSTTIGLDANKVGQLGNQYSTPETLRSARRQVQEAHFPRWQSTFVPNWDRALSNTWDLTPSKPSRSYAKHGISALTRSSGSISLAKRQRLQKSIPFGWTQFAGTLVRSSTSMTSDMANAPPRSAISYWTDVTAWSRSRRSLLGWTLRIHVTIGKRHSGH
jgi:hypothetical protein